VANGSAAVIVQSADLEGRRGRQQRQTWLKSKIPSH
jgi:hypothetical protein